MNLLGLLEDVLKPGWREQGNCWDAEDPDRFVEGKSKPPECGGCPVAAECLAFGKWSESEGWWGGEYLAYVPEFVEVADTEVQLKTEASVLYMQLWAKGMTDAQMAAERGVARQSVRDWRTRLGLPAHECKRPLDKAVRT